ncbi:MAG: hypothetical protein IT577_22540 [Verrucomicrobiae bacterium]|nr:hypothetical protein [Verrucomicrobiae bacterium]
MDKGFVVWDGIALLAMVAIVAATITWMTGPVGIIHGQSSPRRTAEYSIEVKQHGRSLYLTPRQKERLDGLRRRVPIFWFGSFAYLFFYFGSGRFEALRRQR